MPSSYNLEGPAIQKFRQVITGKPKRDRSKNKSARNARKRNR